MDTRAYTHTEIGGGKIAEGSDPLGLNGKR